MSVLNIVIHILFASTDVLSVEREVEDKIAVWCQQEKSSNSKALPGGIMVTFFLHLVGPHSSQRCTWPRDNETRPYKGSGRQRIAQDTITNVLLR